MAEFKDRLRELRKEKGLTQQQLADLLGNTESNIRKYENGSVFPRVSLMSIKQWEGEYRTPRMDSLIGLARYFEVTTDYLLGLSDQRNGTTIQKVCLNDIPTYELLTEIGRRCSK